MAVLEDQGYRSTAPRRAIVQLLERKQDGFSAEDICNELPSVGRATVYRTIKLLLNAGVICKLALMDGAPMYSLSRIEHHHHTVCVRCGTVGEFRAATVERLLRAVGDDIPRRHRRAPHRVLRYLRPLSAGAERLAPPCSHHENANTIRPYNDTEYQYLIAPLSCVYLVSLILT